MGGSGANGLMPRKLLKQAETTLTARSKLMDFFKLLIDCLVIFIS